MANQLKEFFAEISFEKTAGPHPFPLLLLDEIFENTEQPITSQIVLTKEFNFPEASGIHISTVWDSDIPPPITNTINIHELPNNKSVTTINRDTPSFDKIIKGTHIKISVNIETIPKGRELIYKGYKLRIRPKVFINIFTLN